MQTLLAIIAGIAIAVCMICFLIVIGQAGQTSPLKRKADARGETRAFDSPGEQGGAK
jgi:hypothetical protein